jgi:hypothetical protein
MSDALRSYFDDMEIALLAHGSDSIPREIVGDWMNGLRARLAAVEQERATPAPTLDAFANSQCSLCRDGERLDYSYDSGSWFHPDAGDGTACNASDVHQFVEWHRQERSMGSATSAPDPETGLAACHSCGAYPSVKTLGSDHYARCLTHGCIMNRLPHLRHTLWNRRVRPPCHECEMTRDGTDFWQKLYESSLCAEHRAALARPDAPRCSQLAGCAPFYKGSDDRIDRHDPKCTARGGANRPDAGEDGASLALRRAAVDLRKLASDWRGQEDFVCGLLRAANEVMARSGLHGGAWTPEEMHEVEDYAARKGAEENGR